MIIGVGGTGRSNFTWRVVYADPGAAGSRDGVIILESQRTEGGVITNRVMGQGKLMGGFAAEQLPRHPVTFAAVERAWRARVQGVLPDSPPEGLGWGYWVDSCIPATCSTSGYSAAGYPDSLSEAYVSFSNLSSTAFPRSPAPVPTKWTVAVMLMDVEQAFTQEFYSFHALRSLEPRHIAENYGLLPPSDTVAEAPALVVPTTNGPRLELVSAVATIGLLVLIALGVKALLSHLGLVPSFAKVQKSELLKNPLRERLVRTVQEEPGITRAELQRRLGAGWSTIVYHLKTLERTGLLYSFVHGRYRRFFAPGAKEWRNRDLVAVLQNPRARHILDLIMKRPGITQADLARETQCTSRNAQWHLKRLVAAGCVVARREGSRTGWFRGGRIDAGPTIPGNKELAEHAQLSEPSAAAA